MAILASFLFPMLSSLLVLNVIITCTVVKMVSYFMPFLHHSYGHTILAILYKHAKEKSNIEN